MWKWMHKCIDMEARTAYVESNAYDKHGNGIAWHVAVLQHLDICTYVYSYTSSHKYSYSYEYVYV